MKIGIRDLGFGIRTTGFVIGVAIAWSAVAQGQPAQTIAQQRQTAEAGDVDAIAELFGKMTPAQLEASDKRTATDLIKRMAAAGVARAQYSMGASYHAGLNGMPKDFAKAAEWFQKAANQGYSGAQVRLAMMYVRGEGVSDARKDVEWLRKAAALGRKEAQRQLGDAYVSGTGVGRDAAQAIQWWRQAADQDDAPSQHRLGLVYEQGTGVEKDEGEAEEWYLKAARQGHAPAQLALANLHAKDIEESPTAGLQAVHRYRRAAEQGEPLAQATLALMYAQGKVVARDVVEGHKWANLAASRAAEADRKSFTEARDLIARSMTSEQIAAAQTRARDWVESFDNQVFNGASPVRVGGSIQPPTKTKDVKPVYPAIAQSARVQGLVMIEVTLGPDGNVVDLALLRSIPLLDAAAIESVRQTEYAPTVVHGIPLPVIMTVTVNFSLK